MALPSWFDGMPDVAMIPLTALGIYVTIILFVRLNGLRSFSTMSAFDFAITVATGSLIAATILHPRPSLVEGAIGLASLFVLQRITAFARRAPSIRRVIDNRPRVLVRDGVIRDLNLRRCHMTRDDLYAKMREAGLTRMRDVALAVMETTGTVSVVRREGDVSPDPEGLASLDDG